MELLVFRIHWNHRAEGRKWLMSLWQLYVLKIIDHVRVYVTLKYFKFFETYGLLMLAVCLTGFCTMSRS